MNKKEQTTLNRIFSAALQEFLEKGYQSASLRNIVKMAGVTTGAFYGYYKSNLQKHPRRNSRTSLPPLPASVCMRCFYTLTII